PHTAIYTLSLHDALPISGTYSVIKLTHVAAITFAGTVANVRLLQLLKGFSANVHAARRVLVAWLAGNLFLGSQLCWILRPFIGRSEEHTSELQSPCNLVC